MKGHTAKIFTYRCTNTKSYNLELVKFLILRGLLSIKFLFDIEVLYHRNCSFCREKNFIVIK